MSREHPNLIHLWLDLQKEEADLKVRKERLKAAIAESLGDEQSAVLGTIDGRRYVGGWQTRNLQKLDMHLLTEIARGKGLDAEWYDLVLREDAVAPLVESGALSQDDLKAAMVGTISTFIGVTSSKEQPEETD